jgi:prevent-host-death family protein
MKRAKISQLRNRLSEFLDHVRAGGRVLVLDRDRPIAEIIPVRTAEGGKGNDGERLAALEREGVVRGPSSRLPQDLLNSDPPGRGADVLAALLEERESSR